MILRVGMIKFTCLFQKDEYFVLLQKSLKMIINNHKNKYQIIVIVHVLSSDLKHFIVLQNLNLNFIAENFHKKYFLMRTRRLCPSIRWSVRLLVHWSVMEIELKIAKKRIFEAQAVTVCVCMGWARVLMGVGCPCPPVRNDIVTPHHLLFSAISFNYRIISCLSNKHNCRSVHKLSKFHCPCHVINLNAQL